MKTFAVPVCIVLFLVGAVAWADSAPPQPDENIVGNVIDSIWAKTATDYQYKRLYGTTGCIDRLLGLAGTPPPFTWKNFLGGATPIAVVTLTLLVADFSYRRRLARGRAVRTS